MSLQQLFDEVMAMTLPDLEAYRTLDEHLMQTIGREGPGYYKFLAKLVQKIKPKYVLELGTGYGYSAAYMMAALPEDSHLTTINLPNPPSADPVGRELAPWHGDKRFRQILGDTREVRDQVGNGVDLLFIDSGFTHHYDLISVEWGLYESALADSAIVCVDDIHFAGGEMERFFDPLPYDKIDTGTLMHVAGFGVFQYDRTVARDRRLEDWQPLPNFQGE